MIRVSGKFNFERTLNCFDGANEPEASSKYLFNAVAAPVSTARPYAGLSLTR